MGTATAVSDRLDYTAPQDAEEFYRRDAQYVAALVRRFLGPGGNKQDAEDIMADIMAAIVTKEQYLQYDPEYVSERTGRRVTWRAFLSHKVALYMRHKREQVSRRASREPLLCDAAAGESGTKWVELFGGEVWDDYPSLGDDEFLRRMRNYLATVSGPWTGRYSLFAAFNELLERIKQGEDFGRREMQATFGITRAQAEEAMARLHTAMAEGYAAPPVPVFTVCGVTLTAAEVRDAADKLRAAKGNHVHRALSDHRLMAEGPRKWYLELADAERRLFPDVRTGSGTHRKPADHVKRAVIHHLERLLAEALVPPPEPEETRQDLLESELWRIGLSSQQVDAVLAAVGKVYAEA